MSRSKKSTIEKGPDTSRSLRSQGGQMDKFKSFKVRMASPQPDPQVYARGNYASHNPLSQKLGQGKQEIGTHRSIVYQSNKNGGRASFNTYKDQNSGSILIQNGYQPTNMRTSYNSSVKNLSVLQTKISPKKISKKNKEQHQSSSNIRL